MRRLIYATLIGSVLLALAAAAVAPLPATWAWPPPPPATPAPPPPDQFYRIDPMVNKADRYGNTSKPGFVCHPGQPMTHTVVGITHKEMPTDHYALGQPGEIVVWTPYETGQCEVGIITKQTHTAFGTPQP